jgi:uncharacterized protein (TIGR03435 family)
MGYVRTISHLSTAYIAIAVLPAQSPDIPDWQITAGGKMSFEVASVKPGAGFRLPAFPLNTGAAKTRGGRFSATFPLWSYIKFAYKLAPTELEERVALAQTPKWVTTDLIAIEARAEGNPTKDQMRLMMQSLLADRFKLAVHFESREAPVFDLILVKSEKTGPKLHPHSDRPPCPDDYTMPTRAVLSLASVFPANCDSDQMWQRGSMRLIGYRNATMPLLASTIYFYGAMAGEVDRRVVDKTGLSGKFDFTVEYAPGEGDGFGRPRAPSPPNPDAQASAPLGATFLKAVREQLGLKLVPTKGPIRMLIIDHVEKPSEN